MRFCAGRVVVQFSVLDGGPLESLEVERDCGHGRKDHDGLDSAWT